MHKTVYELERCLPVDEFCEWIAWFELQNPNATPTPLAYSEADYNAMRTVLN